MLAPLCALKDVLIDAVCIGIECCSDSFIEVDVLRFEGKIIYLNFINFYKMGN